MIEDYLLNRTNLCLVVQLVDYRHTPSEDDVLMYQFLKFHKIPTIIILTKEDKVKRNDRLKNLSNIMQAFDSKDKNQFIPFSSINKINIGRIWEALSMYL